MKAKEFVKMFIGASDKEKMLVEISQLFIGDIVKLVETRHAKKDDAIRSCIVEVADKYKSFAKKINVHYGEKL